MVHTYQKSTPAITMYIYVYIHTYMYIFFTPVHCKKLKVVLTLLWFFELQLEYTIATAGKCFRDKHRAMSNLASENHHPLVI